MKDLESQNFSFVSIASSYRDKALFQAFMNKYNEALSSSALDSLFKPQIYKYIKLFSSANPIIAQDIKQLKLDYADEKYFLDDSLSLNSKYSIVHWIILEPTATRYYPYGEFMSNVLWYVDKNWEAFYGIEKYTEYRAGYILLLMPAAVLLLKP